MAPQNLKDAVRMSMCCAVVVVICTGIYGDMLDPLFADGSYRQLIIDDHTMKLLSGVIKVSDLMDHGVAGMLMTVTTLLLLNDHI